MKLHYAPDACCLAVHWANFLALLPTPYRHLKFCLARVAGRPAVQGALRTEGLAK